MILSSATILFEPYFSMVTNMIFSMGKTKENKFYGIAMPSIYFAIFISFKMIFVCAITYSYSICVLKVTFLKYVKISPIFLVFASFTHQLSLS